MGPPQILTKVAVSSCKEKNTNQTPEEHGGAGTESTGHHLEVTKNRSTQGHWLMYTNGANPSPQTQALRKPTLDSAPDF